MRPNLRLNSITEPPIARIAALDGSGTTYRLSTMWPLIEFNVYPSGRFATGPDFGKPKVWVKSEDAKYDPGPAPAPTVTLAPVSSFSENRITAPA